MPSRSVATTGRIAALLELGFNPDFGGRENAYMSAANLASVESHLAQALGHCAARLATAIVSFVVAASVSITSVAGDAPIRWTRG